MNEQTQKNFYRVSKLEQVKEGLIIVLLLIFISSCSKVSEINGNPGAGTGTIDCSTVPKTFRRDVMPVIEAGCGGCHGAGSNNGPGALTTYAEIFNAKIAIRSAVELGRMPQNGTLTAMEKATILCWIDNGAPNN